MFTLIILNYSWAPQPRDCGIEIEIKVWCAALMVSALNVGLTSPRSQYVVLSEATCAKVEAS
jgi:hypothetical protein